MAIVKKGVVTMSLIQSYSYLFDSLLGAGSKSSTSIFANNTSLLGDYSMIQSGAYKKLLTAYYKQQDSEDSETSKTDTDKKTAASTTEKAKLLETKTTADSLKTAADALNSSSLYRATGKDEDGKTVYNIDKIKDAVKGYVSAYNSYIDASSGVDSTTVLSKALSVVKATASNKGLLSDVGITIGKDNKLVLDEEKLSKASVSTLSRLFKGSSSYGGTVATKASETARLANSAAYTGSNASSYTYSGNYSVMGSTNNMLDEIL